MSDHCQCNKYINECLKELDSKNNKEAFALLCKAFNTADTKFTKLSQKNHSKVYESLSNESVKSQKDYYLGTLLELYDIFFLYGRAFKTVEIRNLIKEALDQGYNIRNKLIRISSFLLSLINEPSDYIKMFTPTEINLIFQGVFIPQGIRLPEPSKLFLNTVYTALLHRKSNFINFLDKIITEMRNDRYNKEYIKAVTDHLDYISKFDANNLLEGSHIIAPRNLIRDMNHFETTQAGKFQDYYTIRIADLEAEYVHVPINVCLYWYQKVFFSFISQTICKESVKEVPIYTHEDLLSNQHYNEVLITNYLKNDYITSLKLFTSNYMVAHNRNFGSIERTSESESSGNSNASQLKWYSDVYEGYIKTMSEAKLLSSKSGIVLAKNENLLGKSLSKVVNKKLAQKTNQIILSSVENMKLLEPIQK